MTEPPTALRSGRSVAVVDNRDDVRQFLATRRARITPQQHLPTHGANRRVPGLRREEVAVLAGVSIDYYTRLERGNLAGVSDSVLEAVAQRPPTRRSQRAHLLDLARTANNTSSTRRRRPTQQQVRPGLQRLLDTMTDVPGARAQRTPRHRRRQPVGQRTVLTGVHGVHRTHEPGPFHLRRPARPGVLPRLGGGRQRQRRHSSAPRPDATPATAT